MNIERVLTFSKTLLTKVTEDGDFAVDATAGNGHDTLFLANLVGEKGHIYSFDIQQSAIEETYNRLNQAKKIENVTLVHDGHHHFHQHLPLELKGQLSSAIFNLGYLPGGDKKIVTTPDTTIEAVKGLLQWLKKGGIIVLVVYHGHEEGAVERDALMQYVATLDQKNARVLKYEFLNQKNNPPFIIAIEKSTP
jgi:16S rRNA C1402 N4-methylase RsmH